MRAARLLPFLLLVAACAVDGVRDASRPADGARADASGDGGFDDAPATDVPPADAPRGGVPVSIAIEPADATLVARNGMPASQAFTVTGTSAGGDRFPVPNAVFTLAHERLGRITPEGVFTASGVAGGSVEVRAEAPGAPGVTLRATTTLTVGVQSETFVMGAPAEARARFAGARAVTDPARAANVLYPLDGAFMPNNVAPPHVQWERGAAGDLLRVRITKPHATLTAYLLHSGGAFTDSWAVPREAWRLVVESDADADAAIQVDRLDAASGEVVTGSPVRVRLSAFPLYGMVYYWNLTAGRILRISADTAAREDVIPNPPQPPAGSPSNHRQCVACHTVSSDGRFLAAELWTDGAPGAVFDLTSDLRGDPAPTVYRPGPRFYFASFSPDSTRLVTNFETRFEMLDPLTGMSVAATGLPTSGAVLPAWSPGAGDAIAYISNVVGSRPIDITGGDLTILPREGADRFGAPRVVHRGADLRGAPEGGAADFHPTWSPDARYIAFAHGANSRSDVTSVPTPTGLYLVARAGGAPVRLSRAMGGPTATNSYWPTFSPYISRERGAANGTYWLAFYSRRDYGNARAGTRGSQRRQLWVTAIDTDVRDGVDPSRVPYWLPGQDTATANMAAYWAPLPCRGNGASCAATSECCSGLCRPDATMSGRSTCQPPEGSACRRAGQSCGGASDCCAGLVCIGNVCLADPG